MKVADIMTTGVVHCLIDSPLLTAAKLMAGQGCGALPVFDGLIDGHVIGMITAHDIVCRGIATGADPVTARVGSCMSFPVITVSADAGIADVRRLLDDKRLKRLPVVDRDGCCIGMVSYADLPRPGPVGDEGSPRPPRLHHHHPAESPDLRLQR